MTYFAPVITNTGMSIPSYVDIRDQLIADAQTIFGSDIYLEPNTQDYQWIATVATKLYDSFLTAQAVYNSRGPATAIGPGLDVIVGVNGIKRKAGTASTATVTLIGTPNTTITNGIVGDVNGNNWSITSPTTISSTGTVTALATCQTVGPITAGPGEINRIVTPTLGWTGVTNPVAAVTGTMTETDASLRARQAMSTAQPSQAIIEGLNGAIAAVSGVKRFVVYENYTDTTDSNGIPRHSIAVIVEGGADQDIGNAIYNRKPPGTGMLGNISVPVTDRYNSISNMLFSRPTSVDIDVTINVKQISGYTQSMTTAIKDAVVSFLNSLLIGQDLIISSLWGTVLSLNQSLAAPTFSVTSVTATRHGQTQGTSDIAIAYNEVAHGVVGNITVNVT
ncbi:baseplate J/gp47 family protein [Paenibacillus sp. P26]|nr:baseplate J/gp47 family protein [Paenibacillus sp. P26]